MSIVKLAAFFRKQLCAVFLLFLLSSSALAQEVFSFHFPGQWKITEKANISRRVDGKYLGLLYRETRGIFTTAYVSASVTRFTGKYYVFEELKSEARLVARRVEGVYSAVFCINGQGVYTCEDPYQIFPLVRDFPQFSAQPVSLGQRWQAYGLRLVDPRGKNLWTRVKFYCDYTYLGVKPYENTDCHYIQAQYAMRYKQGDDPCGEEDLAAVSGKHVVTIILPVASNSPAFMRDQVEELYTYTDAHTIEYQGFILTWFESISKMERREVATTVTQALEESKIPDVTVKEDSDGVKLSLQNIHFIVNTAEIMPDEISRLDALAAALKKIPGRTFLVIGHTTDIGDKMFLYDLSVKRAKAIVDELVKRGIPAERFIYEGRGGTQPLVPNDSEEHKQMNRRVEIIILED